MYPITLPHPPQPATPRVADDAIRLERDPLNRQQVVIMLGDKQLGYVERDFCGWLAYANLEPCGGFARADLKEFGFDLRAAVQHVIINGTPL